MIKDEIHAFKTVTWPLMKKDLVRAKWYYLGFIPPALMGRSLERELRRDLDRRSP